MVRENGNGEDPSAKGSAGRRKKNCSSGVGDGGRRRSFAACCATSKIAKLWWSSPKIGLGEFGPGPQEQSTELPGLAIRNFTTTFCPGFATTCCAASTLGSPACLTPHSITGG
jgi:hypothetical protein